MDLNSHDMVCNPTETLEQTSASEGDVVTFFYCLREKLICYCFSKSLAIDINQVNMSSQESNRESSGLS